MKRLSTIITTCALALPVAIPAGAGAAGDGVKLDPAKLAAKQCAAEKKADKDTFRATYGKHAMRDCIRAHRGEAEQAIENAAQQCGAEQEADPAAFTATYGTNGNGSNAFGKCVSQRVHESEETSA